MSKLSKLLQDLKSNGSTLKKTEILMGYQDDTDVQALFKGALDNQINYYLRGDAIDTSPLSESGTEELNDTFIYQVIGTLNNRKITGHAARDWLNQQASRLVPEDKEVLSLMLNRDLDCKVSVGLVDRVWPDLISEYPCLLACKLDAKRIKELESYTGKLIVQTKADGGRCNGYNRDGDVTFFSRNGKALLTHGVFDEVMKSFEGYMVDGELLVYSNGNMNDRQTGNGIFNKAVRQTITEEEAKTFHFVVWDMIPLEKIEAGLDGTPYENRLRELADRVRDLRARGFENISLIDGMEVSDLEKAQEFYEKQISMGYEGAILKYPDLQWENGRSKKMIKMKEEKSADLICVGWKPHGKREGWIGSLELETSDGLLKVNTGSGLNDEDRQRDPNFFVGKIIEMKYNAIIQAKSAKEPSMFLPIYKNVRLDKTTADSLKDLK